MDPKDPKGEEQLPFSIFYSDPEDLRQISHEGDLLFPDEIFEQEKGTEEDHEDGEERDSREGEKA